MFELRMMLVNLYSAVVQSSFTLCHQKQMIYVTNNLRKQYPQNMYLQVNMNRAATCDFQQCGSLTCVDLDEPVQPPFKEN